MKKALIALAVLGLTGGAAVAQSTVTLFGVIDADLRYVKSGDRHIKQLGSDGLNSSRIGVRGIEDLGGGLKAGFWLESGIKVDTGEQNDSARYWNRRVSVSLLGDFGEVRLGRGKTSTRLHIDDFDPFSTTGIGDVSKVYSTLKSNADTLNRSDNLAQYFLPGNLGGFYGSLDLAAGEGADVSKAASTSTGGKKMQGGRLGYKEGPILVEAAFQSTTGAGNSKWKITSLGGSYDFGVAKPMLNYSETKFDLGGTVGTAKQQIVTLGVIVPVGQGQVLASYTDAKAKDAAKGLLLNSTTKLDNMKLFAVGYVYNLSKRTALYTTYSQIKNENGSNFGVVAGAPAAGFGEKTQGYDVGVRHSF